jgi:hypothetical protein
MSIPADAENRKPPPREAEMQRAEEAGEIFPQEARSGEESTFGTFNLFTDNGTRITALKKGIMGLTLIVMAIRLPTADTGYSRTR